MEVLIKKQSTEVSKGTSGKKEDRKGEEGRHPVAT